MKCFRFPGVVYIVFLLYEVLKTVFLSARAFSPAGSLASGNSVFEHAAAAALCLVPVMYFMLAANEKAFSFCLPLVAIAKGLSLLSFAFLSVRVVKSLFLSAQALSDFAFVIYAVIICVSGDLVSVIFCLRRQKKICG